MTSADIKIWVTKKNKTTFSYVHFPLKKNNKYDIGIYARKKNIK